jgi:carbon-monoxide dehydrogenase iron sulfur subunit
MQGRECKMELRTRKRIYPKEEVCIGCHLCEIYCILAHSGTTDLVKAFNKLNKPSPRVIVEEKDEYYVTFALQCRHCDDPLCIKTCITGAMHRDEKTGYIICNEDKCVGCWSCILVCPYGAIRRDKNKKIASKCDLCIELGNPVCVENCPNEALELKELEELR